MPPEELETLLHFFQALADETRLKILGIVANRECSVEELAAMLQLKAPTISHHLAKLKELDLVTKRVDGNIHYYTLNAEALRNANKLLLTPEKVASLVDDVEGDAWERKVLKDFFDGAQLKDIPNSRKKREVVLKWFASRFEDGVLYPEAEVNKIIQNHHTDAAFWRRELIGTRLLCRHNSFYWRVPLSTLPTDEAQRTLILGGLVNQFDSHMIYTAVEIEAVIARFYPHNPTLRQELLDAELLKGEGDMYWRL